MNHQVSICHLRALPAGLPSQRRRPGVLNYQDARSEPHSATDVVLPTDFIRVMCKYQRTTRDEMMGLCSRPVRLGALRLMIEQLTRFATLSEGTQFGLRYYRALISDFSGRLQQSGNVACIKMLYHTPTDFRRRVAHGFYLYWSTNIVTWLMQRHVPITGVGLAAKGHECFAGASNVFDVPISYDWEHSALQLDRRWLEMPIVSTGPERDLCSFFVNLESVNPTVINLKYRRESHIRFFLSGPISCELPGLEDLASRMHISPSFLRASLASQGTGRSLKNAARLVRAKILLTGSTMSTEDIAQRLGFSEASAFCLAFRRWAGITPGKYRQECASGARE